ncbi:MAG: threonine/serine dehydratase [Methylocystis sp.]|nr:threonine/serine dehydratase [Methylocystis sp.]MCA3589814.1 threonine/serine dehydratase [Methylocystis sp.]MCA3591587.1 threonine/serine dehydratase [Methylocystis sp.]
MKLPVSRSSIRAAYRRIEPHIRRTPVIELPTGAFGIARPLSLKLELFQHAGSFKPRGAFNTLTSIKPPKAGVAAASGGNHGAAVAYAARAMKLKARIFVPEISSPAKIAKIREFGADAVVQGARYNDALALCEAYQLESGAYGIHAFDAWPTIEGQGTLGLEWESQSKGLDTVLIAAGGGGLISGAALWFGKRVKVVGVEPEGSKALHAALTAGKPVDVTVESVAADSLGARNVGDKVYAACAANVEKVVLVPDDAIRLAMRKLWSDMRIAAEPGGATALAALLSGAYKPAKGERVGVLVCGGNVDLTKLAEIAG